VVVCVDPKIIQPNSADFKNSFSSRSSTKDDEDSNLSDKIPQIKQNDLEEIINNISNNTIGSIELSKQAIKSYEENDEEDSCDDNNDEDDADYDIDSDETENEEEKPSKRILRKRTSNIPRVPQNNGQHKKRNNTCSDKKSKFLKID
jgi:hypothetical protein